ncbi:hypothetical protein GCM10017771_87750 [Streptomyces capitiformicae]|uniref:Transposase n=1 Tax=Streptomyces capitiformicae TaxID=2014920 RepID=A0A919DNV0_9ACTN|nr:hypothetical protein GCM10017771_87750 [Streptomyces capitiformicae]
MAHLGTLASKDLKERCMDGLEHSTGSWAARKRDLTARVVVQVGRVDHEGHA